MSRALSAAWFWARPVGSIHVGCPGTPGLPPGGTVNHRTRGMFLISSTDIQKRVRTSDNGGFKHAIGGPLCANLTIYLMALAAHTACKTMTPEVQAELTSPAIKGDWCQLSLICHSQHGLNT